MASSSPLRFAFHFISTVDLLKKIYVRVVFSSHGELLFFEKGFPPVHIALEREMLHLSLSKFVF
jgi:hypothetical protein